MYPIRACYAACTRQSPLTLPDKLTESTQSEYNLPLEVQKAGHAATASGAETPSSKVVITLPLEGL
jgi:hypothetical protein